VLELEAAGGLPSVGGCARGGGGTRAGAPEHFQRKAPGAPLAGIDFGCNIQQLGHCNVPLAVAPFPYSSVPRGNGLRRRRASRRAPNPLRPRSVIQTRKTQKKIRIRYYFARQYRKFTVEGPVAGGLALVWLGYGRSGLGIVTWENLIFFHSGHSKLFLTWRFFHAHLRTSSCQSQGDKHFYSNRRVNVSTTNMYVTL
jgi:hypothetical protein